MFRVPTLAFLALAFVSLVQAAKYCPSGDLCYSVSLPDTTVSSGSGDIYFQIQGPASKQWIGLGQGRGMGGANIFIIYADPSGSNVTLSPRAGKGNFQPNYDQGIQAYLLEGSGIADGKMTANVRCSSCIEWHGNTLAVNSTKSNWIWAAKDGPAVSSSSQGANLQMHDDNGQFTFDLTQSRSGNSLNPFADQATTTAAAGSSTSSAAASSGERDSGDGDSLSASSSSSGEESGSSEGGDGGGDQILIAHGVIMSLAWVIFFPLGAIIIRALPSRHVVRLHYMTQVFAYILALTGMALGIYVAVKPEYLINIYHPIIGLVVMGLATIQPILGTIHHRIYKAKQQRTGWAVAHVWLGRIVITLAIINGGLGLRMAANTKDGEIAYGVVAGVVWLVWMAVAIRHEVKNARATGASESQKHTEEKVSSS